MIVDRVLHDLDIPDPADRGGNPLRGSMLGRCARQLGYMLYPGAYPPTPLPARAKLVFKFGDMIHALIRTEFHRVVPGEFGFDEERFHFTVPLSTKDAKAAQRLFAQGHLKAARGLRLSLSDPALHIPLHVDGIADLSPFSGSEGLAAVEIKSMATGSFLRALKGHVDYAYRVQMAAAVEATGLDAALYVAMRKDTCHALEVIYSRQAESVEVTFTKQAQMPRVVSIEDGPPWEAAIVQHPFEPHLLDEARERVRKVLRSTATNLPEREYGPDFTCDTCQGTGTQTLGKSTGLPLKRGPKRCEDCESGDVIVSGPDGGAIIGIGPRTGRLARAELPFQCRYCPFVVHCWPMASLEIVDERPHFWVDRREFEAAKITVQGHGP